MPERRSGHTGHRRLLQRFQRSICQARTPNLNLVTVHLDVVLAVGRFRGGLVGATTKRHPQGSAAPSPPIVNERKPRPSGTSPRIAAPAPSPKRTHVIAVREIGEPGRASAPSLHHMAIGRWPRAEPPGEAIDEARQCGAGSKPAAPVAPIACWTIFAVAERGMSGWWPMIRSGQC